MVNQFKIIVAVVVIVLISYLLVGFNYKTSTKDQQYEYGASFSVKYAEELGLDWKETYTSLLDDLGLEKLRLMSYWDTIEVEEDTYSFEDLDWQLAEAQKRDVEVVLVVGARQPRYPECHLPGWLDDKGDQELESHLIGYVAEVVSRYSDNQAIVAWQLENEPRNVVFSTCRPFFDRGRLQKEFDQIKAIDRARPVYMTLSTEFQLPISGPIGDKVGYSVYERVNASVLGKNVAWQHLVPSSWHSFRSGLIDALKDRETYVHELQAEPWGRKATAELSLEEQSRSMTPEMFLENLEYAKKTGNKEIYFWGAEWWYWQKTVNDNPEMWNTARDILKNNE